MAAGLTANFGKTKVILRGVTGGDGLDDFRPGSNTGDTVIDIYGEQTEFEQGKCYLMEITPYDPETASATGAKVVDMKAEPAAEPETKEFEGLVTITTVGGEVMISVKEFVEKTEHETEEKLPVAEPVKEETTDTQVEKVPVEQPAGAAESIEKLPEGEPAAGGLANTAAGSEATAKEPEGGATNTQAGTGTEPVKEGAAGNIVADTATDKVVEKMD